MVVVGEGGVVTVDVEGDREHLRHDAVVSDQRCQTAVHLQEPLTQVQSYVFYETVEKQPKCHLDLISIVNSDDDVVSDAQGMESLGNSDGESQAARLSL